jgi:site-specific recombinase XerD
LGQLDGIRNADRFDSARTEAEKWFDIIGDTGSPLQRTVADACTYYVTSVKDKTADDKAAADIEHRLKRDVLNNPAFSTKPLSALSKSDFDAWRQSIQYKHQTGSGSRIKKASATINRDMTPLRAAMNLAYENQWVTKNTWKAALKPISVRQDPTVERSRQDYLSVHQRRLLIDKVDDALSPFIRAMCLVPVRPGALAKLKVSDYDHRQKLLTISSDKANPRSIHVSEQLANLLRRSAKDKLPAAPLFCDSNGNHWNKDKWKSPFKKAVNALGLPETVVMYTVRHSVITDLIAASVPVLTVAQLAGTSIRMIEKHYGKLLKADSVSALDALAI